MKVTNSIIWGFIILTLLAGFWLRLFDLDLYPPGISNDEAVNVIDAFHIRTTGNFPLYQDQGRPEPLFRLFQAVGGTLFGDSIWAYRLVSSFFGLLTIASAYWATTQSLADLHPTHRKIAGLASMIVLAVMLSHLTVTRSTYRAVPQPLWMLLMIGFLMRGLRTHRWRDFIWAGFWLAIALYTYTASFMLPFAFIPLGIGLLIFRYQKIKQWLPRLVSVGVVLFILMIPVLLLLIQNPVNVVGRASNVSESATFTSFNQRFELLLSQFFQKGDINPQYNVAHAPLLSDMMFPLFMLGLIVLIIRLKHPSSWFIGGLLIVPSLPVLLTDEIPHGLRIVGEFAVIPLVIGVGIGFVLWLILKFTKKYRYQPSIAILTVLIILLFSEAITAFQTYRVYWEEADSWQRWSVYGFDLNHNEWFFRTDRLTFAGWVEQHNNPLLIPIDELNRATTRAWLLDSFPNVDTAQVVSLPENTKLVIPYSLELGDVMRETSDFALLQDATITLLPPLSEEFQEDLIADIEAGTEIRGNGNQLTFLGYAKSIDNLNLEYETSESRDTAIATFGDGELELTRWYGADTIQSDNNQTFEYTLLWSLNRQIGHEYIAFLQLVTQNWEAIDGVQGNDKLIHRWLYPASIWQTVDLVPDTHAITLSNSLPAGAYRLITGLYYANSDRIPAQSLIRETVNNAVTVVWIKVPQAEQPMPSENAILLDATLNNTFSLIAMDFEYFADEDNVIISLYWKTTVNRPNIDATVFVHALDENGDIITQSDLRPWGGQYPTFIWDTDEIIRTEHLLEFGNKSLDNVTLTAGMYTQPDFVNLIVTQDGELRDDNRIQLGQLIDILP